MASLDEHGLKVVYETVLRAEEALKNENPSLEDLFIENPRLIISPSNRCSAGCCHCVSDSVPDGAVMPYGRFAKIDPEFFGIFKAADFGRRGNPVDYASGGKDIVDLLEILNESGINLFTLAAAKKSSPGAIDRLEGFAKNDSTRIETMLTYHHYFRDNDDKALAKEFNSAIKDYMRFSSKMIISLLGDGHFPDENERALRKSAEVQIAFNGNWKIIFDGIKMSREDGGYSAEHGNRKVRMSIPKIDERVYPLGRFRKYLMQRELLGRYEEEFVESLSDYACPDMVKWPGMIIEPDGGLNLCGSFEAINSRKAVITNIFDKSLEEVKGDLKRFHKKELEWFINNLDGIIEGKVPTCKLQNGLC